MRRKEIDRDAIFQPVRGAAIITGLSEKYIRAGCRDGTIPFVMCGADYRVNMPLFLAELDRQSKAAPGVADRGRRGAGQGLTGACSLSVFYPKPGEKSRQEARS